MRRRTFIRTLPAAAVASTISIYNEGEVQATSTSDATPTLAQFQSPGEERFIRPDVHAGDRPPAPALLRDRLRWAAREPPAQLILLRHKLPLKCSNVAARRSMLQLP